jgi:hypothetical protein
VENTAGGRIVNWRQHFWFLLSRKVHVAIAVIVVAVAAQYGWALSETTVTAAVAIGVALILGIAHEDNGAKKAENGEESPLVKALRRKIRRGEQR